jgi:hypothetical protein
MRRREISGDDGDPDGNDDADHRQRNVPLLAEGHQQLHAELHPGERGEGELLRVRDRQALAQRLDPRLRPHRPHGKGGSASAESDQAGDGRLRRNQLI